MIIRILITLAALCCHDINASPEPPPLLLTGVWINTDCSPYNDNLNFGRYNFNFESLGEEKSGSVRTFIEYFKDFECTEKEGGIAPQVRGTYTVLGDEVLPEKVIIQLKLKYEHLEHPLLANAELTHNHSTMKLCILGRRSSCFNLSRMQ